MIVMQSTRVVQNNSYVSALQPKSLRRATSPLGKIALQNVHPVLNTVRPKDEFDTESLIT